MKNTSFGKLLLRALLSICTLVLIIFIFSNSMQTAEISSESSGWVMGFLNDACRFFGVKPFFTQGIVRTLAHFCEFGLLGVLTASTFLSWFNVRKMSVAVSVAVVLTVSVTDECIQLFSDGRAFQLTDIAVDLTGSLIGILLVFLIALIFTRKVRKGYRNGKCNE